MIKIARFIVLIVGVCLLLAGCSFKKAEEKGKEIFPEVQKFDRLMDKTIHEIGWHSGVGDPLSWRGKGLVYGRYLIHIRFNVSVSVFNEPKRTSDPFYTVVEYWYRNDAFGMAEVLGTRRGVLSQTQWDQVEKVDDISKILGLVPSTNQPIDRIKEYSRFNN